MEGNFLYSQGRFMQAISAYMDALDHDDSVPYAEYGLATVYLSMNEKEAALGRLEAALGKLSGREADRELLFRITYNMGIIFFEDADYAKAASQFRKALELDSGRVEAKRNLELCLFSQMRENAGGETSAPLELRQNDGGNKTLFDYMREKEQEQWKSREWQEDTDSGELDY